MSTRFNEKKVAAKVLQMMSNNDVYDILEQFLDQTEDEVLKPSKKAPHVGIEVECFSTIRAATIMAIILDMNLEKYVRIGEDGSIEPDAYGRGYELKILIPENELSKVCKKLGVFFKRCKLKVNDSCGLHVHLDMRHRKVNACYDKLIKIQDVLYGLVDRDRWNNTYCGYSKSEDRIQEHGSRFKAVNYQAYHKYKTLEVRLHHGSVNAREIESWVRLLLAAINSVPYKTEITKKNVLAWGRAHRLGGYLRKKFSEAWLKEKKRKEMRDRINREAQQRRLSHFIGNV